jgi:Tfp pilus assembly protein PilN
MKFYLTKAAQLEAEGKAPKAAKPEKAAKPAKATKGLSVPAESTGRRVKSAAAEATSLFAPPAAASSPVPPVASVVPVAPASFVAAPTATPVPVAAPPVVLSAAVPVVAETPVKAHKAPKAAKDPAAPKALKQAKQPRNVIAIGGQPRVDLLPLEVRAERKAGIQVRRAWLGVAAVVVLVGIGVGAATLHQQTAAASLVSAQSATGKLSHDASQYSAVKETQSGVDLIDAAREVGGATDVDWTSYLAKIALTVPSGATLSAMTVDSASPILAYAQASAPLQGQRVATLTLTATSTSLPSVPTWLNSLASLPGYVDATAGTVALTSGVYTSTVTLHVDSKVFSNAYKKGN